MSPQLEAVLMVSAAGCTACAGIVTWAVVVTSRSRGNWATAASNLATRITDETNRRQQLEERVARLEDRQRTQTGTGPRLGVPMGRSGGQGQERLRSVPGAAEGQIR